MNNQQSYLVHSANILKDALKTIKNGNSFAYDKNSLKIFLSTICETLSILEKDEETLNNRILFT